jgi:secreted trypsin-like serine protease
VKFFYFVLYFVISMTLFGCDQYKPANKGEPRPQQKSRTGVCEPQKALVPTNIVGGTVVQKGQPDDKTVVMLLDLNEGTICTAAPIGPNVLLTAAHCVGDDYSQLVASFYPTLSCEEGFDVTKKSIRVSRVARHSGYNMSLPVAERTDDIALVFLRANVPDGYPIYKIADPQAVNEQNKMFLYGYGVVGEKRGGAGVLRKTTVDSSRFNISVADKKVRVDQADASGFCMGDSGGPGMVLVDNQLEILGVNSYVQGHDGDICNKFGFQTLVSAYKEWIDFQMK